MPDDCGGLRVLIAEDAYIAREGTRRLLAESPGIEVVGVAADYDEVTEAARRLRPDVVLMDIKMPPTYSMEGIDAAHAIKQERPETGVVVLSQHDDEEYVWTLLRYGVEGYGYLHKVRVGDAAQLVRAMGRSNQAIADELHVSMGTVEKRIATVLSNLGVGPQPELNRRVAAVLIYLRESAATG